MKYATPKNVKNVYSSEAHMSNNSCGKKKEHVGCKLVQGNEILLLVCTNFRFHLFV